MLSDSRVENVVEFLALEIRGFDAMKQLEIPGKHLRSGETEINRNLLDRGSLAKQRPGGHHAFLAEPILGSDADSVFENPSQVTLGNSDAVTETRHAVFTFTGNLAEGQWKRFACQKHEESPITLYDFYVAAFHSWLV